MIKSVGSSLVGTSDAFGYRAMPVTGNITMVARLLRMDSTTRDAWAGIQIRQSLDAGSPYVMLGWTPQQQVAFFHRDASNQSAFTVQRPATTSLLLKLTRDGDLFIGEVSSDDGFTFSEVGRAQIMMLGQTYVGVAVTSNDCKPTTAIFDQLRLEPTGRPGVALSVSA
jgi:hypothetical protein